MPMNDLGNESRHAAEYLEWFRGIWPLALLACVLAFLVAAGHIKRSYRQRSLREVVVNLIWSGLVGGSMAVGAVALLPLAVPDPTRGMEIGVAVFVGLFGFKGVDAFLRRKWGLSVVNLMDPDDINDIRKVMSPSQQEEHARNCPFRCDDCRRK